MPRRDGTGPMGYGPLTGWGLGSCRGGMYPRRFGYGYFRGYVSPNNEKVLLQNERNYLKARLEEIEDILEGFKDE